MNRYRSAAGVSTFLPVLALVAGGCGETQSPPAVETSLVPQPFTGSPWFRDVTEESGINFVYRNGEEADRYAILESIGGGVAAFDYDGDGRLDLFFPGGGYFDGPGKQEIKGYPPKMYRNLGNWKFADVTTEVGFETLADGVPWFYSHGVAVADYDRDGWPDLLVTGYGRVALFHNESAAGGGRRFREVTQEAGMLGPHIWVTSAAWGDLDGDGWADLYLCQYVDWSNSNDPPCRGYYPGVARDICPPKEFRSVPHVLFRNLGNGKFNDVSRSAGLRTNRPDNDYGKGLGVIIVDVDGDGKPDVYVANDTTDNFLYMNRSEPGTIRLEELAMELGVARDGNGLANGSMGVDAGDYHATGRPAVWVANYENEFHALYRNRADSGRLVFTFSTPAAGIGAIGPVYVGFGTAFVDVDSDGWEDIVVNNGHVMRHSPQRNNIAQRPILFHNLERPSGRFFIDAKDQAGPYFTVPQRGRGLAVADLDNDGRPDLVFANMNGPSRVLRNEAPGAHWLGVELIGNDHRDYVGATVTLEVNGSKLTRFHVGGRSYLSSCDSRKLFGLGASDNVGRLTVHWPTGLPHVEHWDGLAIDRYHRIEQGKGTAE